MLMVSHCDFCLTDGNAQRCQQAQTQRTGHGPSTRVPAQRSHLCKCGIRSRCLPALPERAAQNLSRGDGDRQRDKTDVLGMQTASDEHQAGLPPPPGSAAPGGCSPAREPANTAWDNTAPPPTEHGGTKHTDGAGGPLPRAHHIRGMRFLHSPQHWGHGCPPISLRMPQKNCCPHHDFVNYRVRLLRLYTAFI